MRVLRVCYFVQSEMTIDDTWPRTGEMRSLWMRTTEFWTSDMPQDDTWQPNRHHSNISPLVRNHLTRKAVDMFLLPLDLVASTEQECRDSHLPAVPHTEHAEEKRRRVVLGVPELSKVYSTYHDEPSGDTESQDAATKAANPSSQRQDRSEGLSPLSWARPGKWQGKGKYVSAVWSHHRSLEAADLIGSS